MGRLSLNEFLNFLGINFGMVSVKKSASKSNPVQNGATSDPDEGSAELNATALIDERSNQNQTDDRHIPLTCIVILVVTVIATCFIVACRGDPIQSLSACGLALNIAVAVFGTNVALTLPGFIYYKILKKQKDYEISTLDWMIISSLIGIGIFASFAGIMNIFISNFKLIPLSK